MFAELAKSDNAVKNAYDVDSSSSVIAPSFNSKKTTELRRCPAQRPALTSQKLNMVFLLHWMLIGWYQSKNRLILHKFYFA